MSNGNPNDPPLGMTGENKKIRIVMTAEGYATSETEWLVPEELLRPYAIAYNAWIAKGGLEISKTIYAKLLEDGLPGVENYLAKTIMSAND